jgi:hypothetical protein
MGPLQYGSGSPGPVQYSPPCAERLRTEEDPARKTPLIHIGAQSDENTKFEATSAITRVYQTRDFILSKIVDQMC